jgi:hypothetical protein
MYLKAALELSLGIEIRKWWLHPGGGGNQTHNLFTQGIVTPGNIKKNTMLNLAGGSRSAKLRLVGILFSQMTFVVKHDY